MSTQKPQTEDSANPFADELTAFQRDILALLVIECESPTSGQTLLDKLEESGYDTVNHGRLYPNLDSLENMGLLEVGEIDRRTNDYQATEEAKREVEQYQDWIGCSTIAL